MTFVTTLNNIRSHNPCIGGWKKLLAHLDKTAPDDEPLDLLTVLESNGLDDTLWCLRAVEGKDKEIRLFAVWCARQVQHMLKDERSIKVLEVAERFANGEASIKELKEARYAAADAAAAYAAAYAAADAAAAETAADAAAAAETAADAAAAAETAAADAAAAAYAYAAAAAAAETATAYAAADAARKKTKEAQEAKLKEILQGA